jgi:hypothetical protein
MTIRRIVKFVLVALALWIAALVLIGVICGGTAGRRVAERIAESLQAEATVESSNLALVRGHLEIEKLAVRKDDLGHLGIDVAEIRCELPPLGIALIDHECSDLHVQGVRFEVSSAAVFQFKRPKHRPVHVGQVVVDDAVLAFSPSAFLPSLGRIEIRIDHAESGATTFKTPLSWLFSLRELRATLDLPAGIRLQLGYQHGKLTAVGGLFGSTPVELPVTFPTADSGDDAHGEIKKLAEMGSDLAERLVARRAQDWIKSKLSF